MHFQEEARARAAAEAGERNDIVTDDLPSPPSFQPPQMDIEETVQGIQEICAALHAELVSGIVFLQTVRPSKPTARFYQQILVYALIIYLDMS